MVMLHSCSGVYSYSDPAKGIATLYREWGDRLVKAGYAVLLVDSFTPRNAPQDQCGNGNTGVSEVNDRPYDAYAGLKYLASKSYVSADKIGLPGWSHGGSSTMASMDVTRFNTSEIVHLVPCIASDFIAPAAVLGGD
jgi:dienelactone hydrolase